MTLAETALWLHERGFVVVPERGPTAKGRQRQAPIEGLPYNELRAGSWRPSREQVIRWWTEDPSRGVGVLNGPASGVLIADVDTRSGGRESELKSLVRDQSGRGEGEHVWWTWDSETMGDLESLFDPASPDALKPGEEVSRETLDMSGVEIPIKITAAPSAHWETGKPGVWLESLPERAILANCHAPTALLDWMRIRASEGAPAFTPNTPRTQTPVPRERTSDLRAKFGDSLSDKQLADSKEWYQHAKTRRWSDARKLLVSKLVGLYFRRGLRDNEIHAEVLSWNLAHCDPPLPEKHVLTQINSVLRTTKAREAQKQSIHAPTVGDDGWDKQATWGAIPPEFPTRDLLGHVPVLHSLTREVAEATQTPADFAALTYLTAGAHWISGRKTLHALGSYKEHPCLMASVFWPSGFGKTRPFNIISPALDAIDSLRGTQLEKRRNDAEADLEINKALLRQLLKKDPESNRDEIRSIKREMREQEKDLKLSSRTITSAGTVEGIRKIISGSAQADPYGAGRAYFFTDEGNSFFSTISARHAATADFDLILSAYSNGSVKVDLRGEEFVVSSPYLSALLLPQNSILQKLAKNGYGKDLDLEGRGMLGRILYALPRVPTEPQPLSDKQIDPRLLADMQSIYKMLDESCQQTLTLSARSVGLINDLKADFFYKASPRGDLAALPTWARRAYGKALKIALVLHCMKHAAHKGIPREVEHDIVRSAVDFVYSYAAPHAHLAWTEMASDKADVDGRRIWERFGDREFFTASLVTSRSRRGSLQWKAERAKPALLRGVERGFWREEKQGREVLYITNPYVRLDAESA